MKEIWKPVVGYEGLYEVSSLGRVRSLDRVVLRSDGIKRRYRSQVISASPTRGGYLCVTLAKRKADKTHSVHKLVMHAFVGPRPRGKEIMHRDGQNTHNCRRNLKYGTPKENAAHKKAHGTHPAGENNPRAKLSEREVKEIRSFRGSVSRATLADAYQVHPAQITRIQRRQTWAHV